MYTPRAFEMNLAGIGHLAGAVGSLELITVGEDGYPSATRLPFVWEGDVVRMHLARANPHSRQIPPTGTRALAVITGPEAYISPSFYAAKAEHGQVVPTWNYSAIHLRGRVSVVEDARWLRDHVEALTDRYEAAEAEPWAVADAPEQFIERQLRGIVGLELVVEQVDGKAKRGQNRSTADRQSMALGLEARTDAGSRDLAVQIRADLSTEGRAESSELADD